MPGAALPPTFAHGRSRAQASPWPSTAALRALTAAEGIDAATTRLLDALRRAPQNRALIAAVDAAPAFPSLPPPVDLLVVPALFWKQHPELGADGRAALHAAERLGIPAARVDTDSRGGVMANARRLAGVLRQRREPLWLLSISKGAAEVRVCLEHLLDKSARRVVAGWLNVGGLPRGTPLVDRLLRGRLGSARGRAGAAALGLHPAAIDELRTDHPLYASDDVRWLEGVEVINVVGVPTTSEVGPRLRRRHRRLSALGPNDGMVTCTDALLPGATLPVAGADHFFTGVDLDALLLPLLACAFAPREPRAAPEVGPHAT